MRGDGRGRVIFGRAEGGFSIGVISLLKEMSFAAE
jgi:hypothetical protein